MRVTWVTRSFLDYRVPIYAAINKLCNNNLTIIYFKDVVPERCQIKLTSILGDRAIGLSGEIRLGGKKQENQTFANNGGLRIPLRPGLLIKLKQTKPDIVISDGFFQWTYAALLLNAFYNIPHLMCYERTTHTERNITFIRSFARKLASNYISGITCNGIETRNYLEKFGYPKDRLFLGNMAADTQGLRQSLSDIKVSEILKIKEKYDLKGFVFLFVGQLIPRKGIMEMLDNWRVFSANKKEINLLIVGDGEQFQLVRDYIRKFNLQSVKILGKVDYSEVSIIYAMSNIFIIPTLEDNWSLVVPEAMSCGLPIISSKYNGCWPELVKPGNGWVFDPLDNNNFNQTLELAYSNKEKWKDMGKASQQIVEEFSPEKIAGKIFRSIKILLNDS